MRTLQQIQREEACGVAEALRTQKTEGKSSLAQAPGSAESFRLLKEARTASECYTPKTTGYSNEAEKAATEGFVAGYMRGYRSAENAKQNTKP
jgi:hypothetical protein